MLTPLPANLGSMKVTTALYFRPGGKSTQKVGVEADVRLPFWFILEDVGETSLDYPLPVQEITPFLTLSGRYERRWKQIDDPLIARLAIRCAARVARDERFLEIMKQNKEARAKDGIVRLADLRKEAKTRVKENDEAKPPTAGGSKKIRDQYEPFISESVNVLMDMVTLSPAAPGVQASAGHTPGASGR
jgi:carboxyl-terminal processing protease